MDEILRAKGWAKKAGCKYVVQWRFPVGWVTLKADPDRLKEICSKALTALAGEPVTATQFDLVRAGKVIQYEP